MSCVFTRCVETRLFKGDDSKQSRCQSGCIGAGDGQAADAMNSISMDMEQRSGLGMEEIIKSIREAEAKQRQKQEPKQKPKQKQKQKQMHRYLDNTDLRNANGWDYELRATSYGLRTTNDPGHTPIWDVLGTALVLARGNSHTVAE